MPLQCRNFGNHTYSDQELSPFQGSWSFHPKYISSPRCFAPGYLVHWAVCPSNVNGGGGALM